MDALDLVLANDDVLQGGAILKLEDGVLVATLGLASAGNTAAVGLHATVERAGDGLDLIVGNGALGGGDGEGSADTEGLGGSRHAGGGNEGKAENDLGLHFVCC